MSVLAVMIIFRKQAERNRLTLEKIRIMLRIGLFGVGHLGKIHAKLIRELNTVYNFIGFFDPNNENASFIESEYQIKRYTNISELIDAVDCIDIVTPTPSHFSIASLAIQKGKHVFIEKPVTENIEEAADLLSLQKQHPVKVQIGHVERFNPAFKKAIPYLENPMFIEVHRLAQYNPRGTDVPVVLDLMIHDLDIVLSTVKSKVSNVSASGVAIVSDTPDITNARIEFENGCVANLTASRISLKNMRKTRFFQSNAYISVDFLTKETEIVKMSEVVGEPDPFDIVLDLGNGKSKKKIEIFKPEIETSNAIREELQTFADAILFDKIPAVSLEAGTQALEVAMLIMQKVKEGNDLVRNNNS